MSKEKGIRLTCSRCGASVFLKELKSDTKETDGGYTTYVKPKYETPPDGWTFKYIGNDAYSCYDLCPSCDSDFDKMFREFWMSDSVGSV